MSTADIVNFQHQTLLQEAADWLVRLDAGELSQEEQHALHLWYQTSTEHKRVWEAACQLNHDISSMPDNLAKPVLQRQRLDRRTLLKSLAAVGLAIPLSWSITREKPWQPWLAAYRTGVGGRETINLDDGTELILNTDTALDVHYDARQRLISLYQGEIYVSTGQDNVRPFSVVTDQGDIKALGTQFAVRYFEDSISVSVNQHAVEVSPRNDSNLQRIEQGQLGHFNENRFQSITSLNNDDLAWIKGELIINNWRMDDFIKELGRYRPGVLRADPDIADLLVSGVFQTDQTDQALEVLQQVFDLQVVRYTDYWVSVRPAKS